MIYWTPRATHRSRMESLPLLDYAVLLMLLIFGIAGYQHVRAVREELRASSGVLRVAVVCSRAAQTGGAR